ncbi:leucyl/phenylalanyl-tRNA--protein transferase [Kamptonema cortianum]|nr:leucyl/phenylalanyl-tRNA--protein transferase [Geitlerinema splendidum]MDK3158386.1 leucyl/phenylalanyl-tRNA--protein transferase [Kamptonema cortianum]
MLVDAQELSTQMLWVGYVQGFFPMTEDSGEVAWYRPHMRALFPMQGMHVSKSLRKTMQRGEYRVTFDTAFESVIRLCFRPDSNWLSDHFVRVYTEAHLEGWAHSCEVWMGDELVGGIYGLAIGSIFSAESMFHRHSNMSKIALHEMIMKCSQLGFKIFDAQIMNPHLLSLGAYEITAEEYERMLVTYVPRATLWSRNAD